MERALKRQQGERATSTVLRRPGGGYLLHQHARKLLEQAEEAAGLPKAGRLHKLRHTCCSRLLDAGVSLADARDFMGHSSVAVTERYAHGSPDRRAMVGRALTMPT